jgi:hypothetical protein
VRDDPLRLPGDGHADAIPAPDPLIGEVIGQPARPPVEVVERVLPRLARRRFGGERPPIAAVGPPLADGRRHVEPLGEALLERVAQLLVALAHNSGRRGI